MENPNIPQDDLLDVAEMAEKIESHICVVLQNNDLILAMSALMSATINCTLSQCQNLDEVIFYRDMFVRVFDSSIRSIKLKKREQ